MKKGIVALCIALLTVYSCSNDDNANTDNVDPVFSQEYIPLSAIDELHFGQYRYIGIKIGDRKFGQIGAESCLFQNTLEVKEIEGKESPLQMIYINKERYKERCLGTFSTRTVEFKLVEEGMAEVAISTINDDIIDLVKNDSLIEPDYYDMLRKDIVNYKGKIEIGFQAGMLRVEDRFSDYSRTSKGEKVYLYFKKY